ncbi:MAG: metallophosphoesterase [Erythrobacter sp.]
MKRHSSRRWIVGFALTALALGCGIAIKAWHDTMQDPVIERLAIESAGLPAGSPPVTIAFLTDIHVAGPDMSPARLERIVERVNALSPDLVAIGGDIVSEKRTATHIYTPEEIVAPLGRLSATYGIVFVPGNHDHWFDLPGLSREFAKYPQITVLRNGVGRFGPVAVAGLDEDYAGHADLKATEVAMHGSSGAKVWLSHSPDVFPQIPVSADLVLAGHTHCGQIAYPWGGAPATASRYGNRYACGVVREDGKLLVTSAGLGTSIMPVRFFTQPEVWLIEIRPPQRQAATAAISR